MAPETRAGSRKKKPTVSRPSAFSLARPLQKNYAVGLEMQCSWRLLLVLKSPAIRGVSRPYMN